MDAQQVALILQEDELEGVIRVLVERQTAVLFAKRSSLHQLCSNLKSMGALQLNMLLSITAIDWMDLRGQQALTPDQNEGERFQVVYHFRSLVTGGFLRLKVWVPEEDPKIDSITDLWASADFMEREVWDMYGIKFENHPNLRRILMYEEFKGHPLRKDYPVQGKQPRIPLRHPEVRNTALDLRRSELVSIRRRGSEL